MLIGIPKPKQSHAKLGNKKFVPFQSGMYENMNVNEEDQLDTSRVDSSVKGYVAPGML